MKKTIIITGASSGLGEALAIKYSSSENTLFLIARSKSRLEKVAKICESNGAKTMIIVSDVNDKERMQQQIDQVARYHKIDIVIACAGVSAGTLDGPETAKQSNIIFSTNVNGVLNTIMPIIPHMIKMRSGNIAIVSSMASIIGLSSAPSYSASKGAVRLLGEGLQGYLKRYNVFVTTIIPGYINTPMTNVNQFPMPFMISADKAAGKIVRAINKNKNIVAFPIIMFFLLKLLSILPSSLVSFINSKLPGKPSFEE